MRTLSKPFLMLLLALAAAGLPACASRPAPGLVPVAVPADATVVPILAGATRRPTDEPGLLFGGDRTLRLNHAALAISIPQGSRPGEVMWPQTVPPDPRASFAAAEARYIDREAFAAALRQRIRTTGQRDVLVFVHGYNTRFDEAAFRFAQIVRDSGAPVTPVLFSWASRGSVAAYPYDRTSADMARDGLERLLDDIAREPAVRDITILAHSMGNIVGMEALRNMGLRHGAPHPKIRNFMMAAPDIDVDSAQQIAVGMGARRPRFTLFISRDDRALDLSRYIWGSRDRLGQIDPSQEPYRTNLARFGVEVVDLTDVPAQDAAGHVKFADSPQIVRLIGARLAAGQGLTGNAQTASDVLAGTAQGAIGVIGTVLTAPLTATQDRGRDGGLLAQEAGSPQNRLPAAR